jgi:hypothetical protein
MKTFIYKNKSNSWEVVNEYPMTEEIFSLIKTGTNLDRAKFYIDKEDFERPSPCTQVEINLCESIINSNKPELNDGDIFELLTAYLNYKDNELQISNYAYDINGNYYIKFITL